MTEYRCYECKNGQGISNYPCIYIDPIGELHNADHIKCGINDAKWIRARCECCGTDERDFL
jgi:hypothetical protein